MSREFDAGAVAELGWKQGAILGQRLAKQARKHVSATLARSDRCCLVATSHDCDILNTAIEKEPVVEVLRAKIAADDGRAGGMISSGSHRPTNRFSK